MSSLTDAIRDEIDRAAARLVERARSWPESARERAAEYAQMLGESAAKLAVGTISLETAKRDVERVRRAAQSDAVLAADAEWQETVDDWTSVGITALRIAVAAAA